MPKKFSSENTKAVAAKARKNAVKEEETLKKEKAKEDEYWKDDDKNAIRKKERKEQQERKKLEQNQKKAELKSLAEQEVASIKVTSKQPLAKITKAQIAMETERRNAAIAAAVEAEKKKQNVTHVEKPLEENINRVLDDSIEARGITEAIAVLSTKEVEDKHPERRLKAAYMAWEEANLPRLKEKHPTLRMSQLKQALWKEWTKSPENPVNQIRE